MTNRDFGGSKSLDAAMLKLITATIVSLVAFSSPASADFGVNANPPYITASIRMIPYGELGCVNRATTQLYAVGASNVDKANTTIRASFGATSILVWCNGDRVILIGAGPQAQAAVDSMKNAF